MQATQKTKMIYPKLTALIFEKEGAQLRRSLAEIETAEGLKTALQQNKKKHKKNEHEYMARFFKARYEKRISEQLRKLKDAHDAPNLPNPLIITVEWKKSRMWGSNPKAYTNYGFVGESIGGCGYDKRSTATAQALNSNLSILKKLYEAKEKVLRNHSGEKIEKEYYDGDERVTRQETATDYDLMRKYVGYGAGYSVIPYFEGGVGVESHLNILRSIGFEANQSSSSPNTDVFTVRVR